MEEAYTQILLHDVTGRIIEAISHSFFNDGGHDLSIDALDLTAGIYIVVLQTACLRK